VSNLGVTKLVKAVVEGPTSAQLHVSKLGKFIVEDTSQPITPPRKRAPRTYIRYGDGG
jgi:hypothetical protein